MADTIKVPGLGPVKSTYVYAGGGIAVGIVVYAYWRAGRGGAEEVVEEGAEEVTGTDLGVEALPEYDYALGAGGYDYGPGGTSFPSYTYPTTGNNYTSNLPTTNAEWAQAAREQLAGEGAAADAASSAIGNYLARLCVSSAQADLIRRANAMIGSPPQGTYAIIPCGSGTTPTTPKPTTPAPSKPPSGSSLKAPTGARVLRTFRTEIQISWTGVQHAAGYAVYRSEPGSATSTWQRQTTTVFPSFQFKGLRPNTSYRFKIETIGRDGKAGGSTIVSARTKK